MSDLKVKVKVLRGYSIEYVEDGEKKVAKEGAKVSISKDEFDKFFALGAVVGLDSAAKAVAQDAKK